MDRAFKTCTSCGKIWRSRDDFLSDPETAVIGYQGSSIDPDHGFFYINHATDPCQTTLAIMVREFSDLYNGEEPEKHLTGAHPCPEHCFYKDNLSDRPERCECRFIRTIMQRIKTWPKKAF
ncbi:MAG TPA: hypothetical protein DDX99_13225 [Desulfofustis sp.]|jgi:hypothetical protein|nr:hypothetical protein [Desulfofustis sp. PB-SRB1]HBH29779.1 hypothetical protein [Desulfofustis sp.]HBH30500.1 hypothetical protein [Desulfofustis sp.]